MTESARRSSRTRSRPGSESRCRGSSLEPTPLATITTSLTAGSKAKGGAAESTAAAFTVSSVTPKRISARLGIWIEDVAAVGQANFESILRENLSLVLSDELDDQAINGAAGNSGADLKGILN